jgi:plastocyanin
MTRPPARFLVAGLAVATVALAVPAGAQPLPDGAVQVLAGPQAPATGYLTQQVLSTQGSALTFTNLDTTSHDVTSRATKTVIVKGKKRQRPLFTGGVNGGGTTTITATKGLKPGTYAFFCSLHPGMTGTLTVQ